MSGGASGYFSTPSDTLDPNLFSGDKLRHEVTQVIVGSLQSWLNANGYRVPLHALHLWLTGSGISYQWAADRGNGDLDVMMSIDIPAFIHANQQFSGWGEEDIAAQLTEQLREDFWPRMAHTQFGDRTYEVTVFFNPGTGSDVRNIHPYAAIDLMTGEWVVRPPQLPEDPGTLYPREWFQAADRDTYATQALMGTYGDAAADLASPNPARRANAEAAVRRVAAQARALYDDIHLGRHGAFTAQGTGYGDFRNFRWQRTKQSGAAQALRQLADLGKTPDGQILPADRAARQAARWRSTR